jgi:hypothetical protein
MLGIVYFLPVVCEIVLVAMQLFHAYRHTIRLNSRLLPTTPLLRTLYADGFAYFVVVVTLRLWTAFIVGDSLPKDSVHNQQPPTDATPVHHSRHLLLVPVNLP